MILGERVRLRAIERDDLPRFVAWLNDPEVRRGLMVSIPLSMPQEEQWFSHMLEQPAEEHPLVIEVNTPEGWTAAGNIAFHDVDWKERCAEIGIFIGEKSLWSRGYGREAMKLMLRHGFNTLNLNRIFLRVYASNQRAEKSYEYAGFVHEGRLRQAHFQDGQYVDVLIMSVLRSEWQA
jgi:RimJ/RimL family protein N-acetyltransferase